MIDFSTLLAYYRKHTNDDRNNFINNLRKFRLQLKKYHISDVGMAEYDMTEEQLEKELAIFILNNA